MIRTINQEDSAWHIEHLFKQRNRIGRARGFLVGYKPKHLNGHKIGILMRLPGIGNKTAKSLLDHFETITNIVNASEKELIEVDGVGKKTANIIKYVVSEELSGYNLDD